MFYLRFSFRLLFVIVWVAVLGIVKKYLLTDKCIKPFNTRNLSHVFTKFSPQEAKLLQRKKIFSKEEYFLDNNFFEQQTGV